MDNENLDSFINDVLYEILYTHDYDSQEISELINIIKTAHNANDFTNHLRINRLKYNYSLVYKTLKKTITILVYAYNKFKVLPSTVNLKLLAKADVESIQCYEVMQSYYQNKKLDAKTLSLKTKLEELAKTKGITHVLAYALSTPIGKYIFNNKALQSTTNEWLKTFVVLTQSGLSVHTLRKADILPYEIIPLCEFHILLKENNINISETQYLNHTLSDLKFYFQTHQLNNLNKDLFNYPNVVKLTLNSKNTTFTNDLLLLPDKLLDMLNNLHVLTLDELNHLLFGTHWGLSSDIHDFVYCIASEDFLAYKQSIPKTLSGLFREETYMIINLGYLLEGTNFTFKKLFENPQFKLLMKIIQELPRYDLRLQWSKILDSNIAKYSPMNLSTAEYTNILNSLVYALTCMLFRNAQSLNVLSAKLNYLKNLGSELTGENTTYIINLFKENFSLDYLHDKTRMLILLH